MSFKNFIQQLVGTDRFVLKDARKERDLLTGTEHMLIIAHPYAREQHICPICGKKLTVPEGYVKQDEQRYMALADCDQHGLVFVRLQFSKNDEGKRIMTRGTSLSEEQSPAYVHTKHLQWQRKMEAQAAAEENNAEN